MTLTSHPACVKKKNKLCLNRNCVVYKLHVETSNVIISLCPLTSKPSSRVQSQKVRFLLLCPGGLCRSCGGWRARSPSVSHWPPWRQARWSSHSFSACPPSSASSAASCPWCRPVSRSWRRGGRRRRRTSKWGGSKWEPGSHTFPWSSTGWCEGRPERTASVKQTRDSYLTPWWP